MPERSFLTDRDWSAIDGELCLVTEFVPIATFENGQVRAINTTTPYAAVKLRRSSGRECHGFIAHKVDFLMLWAAFKARMQIDGVHLAHREGTEVALDGLQDNEEVWLTWTAKNYRPSAWLMKRVLPRLVVTVAPKGGFELLANPDSRPDLKGEARFINAMPSLTWTPEVMKR